jgi:hypothetical protein
MMLKNCNAQTKTPIHNLYSDEQYMETRAYITPGGHVNRVMHMLFSST